MQVLRILSITEKKGYISAWVMPRNRLKALSANYSRYTVQ
ncbi:hypothetical protein PORCAN_260 [Porphyromonas crevioricanis JCM 13913]|nr:hypothetical protein PORCAN_260 [Porphyromonas crevioricanis JCM 13913]